MWVRSEYAAELAVLFTWASALVPWAVNVGSVGRGVTLVDVYFQFFRFRFLLGIGEVLGERPFLTVFGARSFPANETVVQAYTVWLAGALVFLVAFVLSVVYYLREEDVEERLPADPVRVLGALLLATALPGAYATVLLQVLPGVSVPVGVLFLAVFGVVLLTVDRT